MSIKNTLPIHKTPHCQRFNSVNLTLKTVRAPKRLLPNSLRGFTLLEVLVALAIVVLTLLSVIRAAGALSENTERLRNAILGEMCAENWIIETRLKRVFPSGEIEETCEQGGRLFALSIRVTSTPNPNFVRVDVNVKLPPQQVSVWQMIGLLPRYAS